MRHDTDDAVLVEAIINLAHQFKLSVVAEGVEDVQTLRQLAALGCDYVQGYHFSQALPKAKFSAWLDDYQADAYWSEAPPPAD
jgi:EAL domain-containing protein (putative c-di-GMP-specific phosphodiesterase class I)